MLRKTLTILSLIGLLFSVLGVVAGTHGTWLCRNDYSVLLVRSAVVFGRCDLHFDAEKFVEDYAANQGLGIEDLDDSERLNLDELKTDLHRSLDRLRLDYGNLLFMFGKSNHWIPWSPCYTDFTPLFPELPQRQALLPYFQPRLWAVSFPLWMPAAICGSLLLRLSVLPFYRRRKRKKLGLCLKCGYDLRASKERCPECGNEFETAMNS